ncbi:MAG: hypothetical protein ACKVOR_11565 [Flavobacteriales bacterium]
MAILSTAMDKESALQLIGAGVAATAEEIGDLIEQKLFEQKQDALQKYMVPTLLLKKTKQLEAWCDAETVLGFSAQIDDVAFATLTGRQSTQTIFLEAYEQALSEHKLRMMNAQSFAQLMHAINQMATLQELYMVRFRDQFNEYSEALPEEANSREALDTGTLLQGLKSGELSASMIYAIEKELARISKIQNTN